MSMRSITRGTSSAERTRTQKAPTLPCMRGTLSSRCLYWK